MCRPTTPTSNSSRLLESEARDALVDQRGGARWLVEHPAVGGRLARALFRDADVWVAHIDDVVVGLHGGRSRRPTAIVRIDQVWVTPEAREVGFGDGAARGRRSRRPANVVRSRSRAKRCPGDRQTKNLYERAGIVARLITTYREL